MAKNLDAYIWDTGGVLIPRGGPVARGLEKEYYRLVQQYGNYGELKLHREGAIYNYYVRKLGKAEVAAVSAPAGRAPAPQPLDGRGSPAPQACPGAASQGRAPESAWQPWRKTSKNMNVGERASAPVASRTRWESLSEGSGPAASGSGFTRPAKP